MCTWGIYGTLVDVACPDVICRRYGDTDSQLSSCRHSANLDNSDSCSKCEKEVTYHSVLNVRMQLLLAEIHVDTYCYALSYFSCHSYTTLSFSKKNK